MPKLDPYFSISLIPSKVIGFFFKKMTSNKPSPSPLRIVMPGSSNIVRTKNVKAQAHLK